MATIYECDITGKQYRREDAVREVGFYDCNGQWTEFEFGPDATIDEVRERLHREIEEFQPFHQDWWDDRGDQYIPPQIDPERIDCDHGAITVPVVEQKPLDN